MSSESPYVRTEVAAGVATITLDSPHNRNALSRRLVAELRDALDGALADGGVRVIVLTGAGPVFCSGADLKEQRSDEPGLAAPLPGVLDTIWSSPKPVLARVNGPARAGGIGLIAACDLVVAPVEATFAFTEVRIGVVPAVISVTCLRRMQAQAARELFLTGETFDAVRAQQAGLVDRAVPAEQLDAEVERFVDMLVRGAPGALAETKRMMRLVPTLSMDEGFAQMAELSSRRFASEEGQEGIRSFLEKRPAAWVPAERRQG